MEYRITKRESSYHVDKKEEGTVWMTEVEKSPTADGGGENQSQ